MNKTEKYLSSAIVAIVRAKSHGEGRELAIALLAAGVTTLEVTSTTPGYLEIISEFADRKDIAIGMGTVLKKSHVKDACAAGAKFIVSPDTSEEVIKLTKKKGLISIPGVATASDVGRAIRFGADALKLFPASSYGPMHLKALSDPFPNQSWIATGGVKSTDVKSWFEVGTTAFGLGGPFTSGGVDEVADRFAIFTTAIREARGDK